MSLPFLFSFFNANDHFEIVHFQMICLTGIILAFRSGIYIYMEGNPFKPLLNSVDKLLPPALGVARHSSSVGGKIYFQVIG